MKIAVITNCQHNLLGGVEANSRLCYEDWTNHFEVHEFPTLNNNSMTPICDLNQKIKIDHRLLGWKPHTMLWGGSYSNKNFHYIYQNYDVVIINSIFPPRKWIKHPKSILVQHMPLKWYQLSGKAWYLLLGQFVSAYLFGVGTWTSAFKHAANIVLYTDYHHKIESKGQKFLIPLSHKYLKNLVKNDHIGQGFVWIGRLDQKQKNIKAIVKLANLNPDITIYGQGPKIKYLKEKLIYFEKQYQGVLKREDVDQALINSRALLVTSNFEGFGLVIVEALSNGRPVIVFDTFLNCRFFQQSKAVFVIPKGDIKTFNQKIKWLRDLDQAELEVINQNAIDFARLHFSKEMFWQKWKEALMVVKEKVKDSLS